MSVSEVEGLLVVADSSTLLFFLIMMFVAGNSATDQHLKALCQAAKLLSPRHIGLLPAESKAFALHK